MSNDARVRRFLEYYAGGYLVRDEVFRAYSSRLSDEDGAELNRALTSIEADPKIAKLPPLAAIVHRLPKGSGNPAIVPDNLTCPRSCRRGELVLQETIRGKPYDFLAPCDCKAGDQAAALRAHRIASYIDGEDLRWRGLGDEQRRKVLNVADYAARGIHPAEVRASPEQRRWLREQGRGGPQSLVDASKRLAEALGARSIASERTPDESAAADAWSERADLR